MKIKVKVTKEKNACSIQASICISTRSFSFDDNSSSDKLYEEAMSLIKTCIKCNSNVLSNTINRLYPDIEELMEIEIEDRINEMHVDFEG